MNKELLCKAFCEELKITEVPIGFAVGTAFKRQDGDAIGFYIVRDRANPTKVRIEDDGNTIPYLSACGVDVTEGGPRTEAFVGLLKENNAEFDADEFVLHTGWINESDLPFAAVRFVSLLLRIQDFLLITRERVEDTFKHDVIAAVQERFAGRARVETDYIVSPELKDDPVDLLISVEGRAPLAVFVGTSNERALEALVFYDTITYKQPFDCSVMLVVDSMDTKKVRPRTLNRITNEFSIAAFKDEPLSALASLERKVGLSGAVH